MSMRAEDLDRSARLADARAREDLAERELLSLRPRLRELAEIVHGGLVAEEELRALSASPLMDAAYRDASGERARELRSRVAAAREIAPERDRLRSEEAHLQESLAVARHDIESCGVRRVLPLVDEIRPASTCSVRWSDMQGDGDVRTCRECGHKVHAVAHMTRREISDALVPAYRVQGERIAYRRDDGTIMTEDCPVGRRRTNRLLGLGALVAALVTLFEVARLAWGGR